MNTNFFLKGWILLGIVLSFPLSAQENCARPDGIENTYMRDKALVLQWTSPEPVYGIFDDFEGHPDFEINSPGEIGWQYLDMDNEETYGFGEYQWKDRGKPAAFQVFNASKTIPVYKGERGIAHSGKKMLMSFAPLGEKRNDWIISPDLSSFGFTDTIRLAFYARTFNEVYGVEQVRVGYSETNATPSSFQWYNNGELIDIPGSSLEHPDMYYFEFAFPSTARYIAINCVTEGGLALCLDDIIIASNRIIPIKGKYNYLVGYNLYRNGEKMNQGLIRTTSYSDTVPDYGNYSYQVEAVYEDCVSERSETLQVNVPDIHQLPWVDHFDSYDLATHFWETEPDSAHYWKIDWIGGRLVDPAASFRPSPGLLDYDGYCLISKELDATNLTGVMFSYDIAGAFYVPSQGMTLETLCAEVFDGQKWVKLKTHTSLNGNFDYKRFYHDISGYVAGKKFRIRFRASGEKALHLIAWYISYVKVYELQKTQIEGTLTCNGTAAQGAVITFTSTDNDVYSTVSGADGKYSLKDVDAGEYTLTARLDGANAYSEKLTLEKGNRLIDIPMVAPVLSLYPESVSETLVAEESREVSIQFTNAGKGDAKAGFWIRYNEEVSGLKPQMKALHTFRPSDLMQAGICFDGTYFYLGSQYDTYEGRIWKYDREGNFIESFIPSIHVRSYYGMAFDGLYFYVATGDNRIRIMDFNNRKVVGEIVTDIAEIKHIAYDSDKDAFYVGGINSIAMVDRSGETVVSETSIENSFTGSVYDPYFEAGPTMWIFDQNIPYNEVNKKDLATIRRLDLKTMKVVDDYVFPCESLEGYVHGQGEVSTWGVGLFGSTDYKKGHFVLMGTIVSDPGLVFVVDMYTLPDWVELQQDTAVFEAEGSYALKLTLDARKLLDGENRSATLCTRTDPGSSVMETSINLVIKGKATHARPLDLAVEVIDDSAAHLTFRAPESDNKVEQYYIYRNSVLIDSTGDLFYNDADLKAGDYDYTVSALYEDGMESSASEPVSIHIEVGIPCYRPLRLSASNIDNSSILLEWLDPSVSGAEPADIRWDNGTQYDGIGLSSGGIFTAAVKWVPSDLEVYRDMPIEAVSFFPMQEKATYTLLVYEGESLVIEQGISEFVPGVFNKVPLKQKILVNDRSDLIVGIRVETSVQGALVLGVDAGPAIDGKGNLVRFEDEDWTTLLSMGGSNANFNIAVHLQPKENIADDEITCEGFHVYRNGSRVTRTPVRSLEYTDTDVAVGEYVYHVTAVYQNCESDYSNQAKARIMDLSSVTEPLGLDAVITMNRQVDLFWNAPESQDNGQDVTSKSAASASMSFSYVKDFRLKNTGEIAVETDGKSIYTTYWNRDGEFNRYDMEGNFIESFTIEGLGAIYDLAYDGEYFYGGAGETKLFCLDLKNKALVKEFSVTVPVRHCAYIPELDNGKGGFEIGEYTTSYFVSKNGAYLNRGVNGLDGAFGSAYHDGKLYYFLQSANSKCEIVEYDFETLEKTGNSVDLKGFVMLDLPQEACAGGLGIMQYGTGTAVLLSSIQVTSPETNRIVMVEVGRNYYVKGYHVYRDGERLTQDMISGKSYRDIVSQPGEYGYHVSAVLVDGSETRHSDTLMVSIYESLDCSAPIGLDARVSGRNVVLTWTSGSDTLYQGDDMESYEHMGTPSQWILLDKDGRKSSSLEEFSYGAEGKVNGFMLVNQKSLVRRQNGLAFSGNKMLMAVAPMVEETSEMTYANDWAIYRLDEVSDNPLWLSFMARGLEAGKTESFKVAYSTTDSSISSMIYLSAETSSVNHLYQRFVYGIPAKARFVAINYTSGNGKALFVDDFGLHASNVFDISDKLRPGDTLQDRVVGYYVYRDGELLTPQPISGNAYFDGNLANGEYTYTVKALYNTSCESELSEGCEVEVAYQTPANPPLNLEAQVAGKDVELNWEAPLYDMDRQLSYAVTDMSSAYLEAEEATYYVASRWNAADLMGVFGYDLVSVTAAFYSQPNHLELLIYQDDNLVYSEDVTQECTDVVSTFILEEPLELDFNRELTVGFSIQAAEEAPTIIVDKGPAVTYKGDLYSQDGKDWISAYVYMGHNSNWCIVADFRTSLPLTSTRTGFEGFRVYRDNQGIAEGIRVLEYQDKGLTDGQYTYSVGAMYEGGVVSRSENVSVKIGPDVSNGKESVAQIWIGPNPTSDKLFVKGFSGKAELCHSTGKLVERKDLLGDDVFQVAHLPAGIYLLRLIGNDGATQTYKVVVM